MESTGIYIHIPFCSSKCRYCSFYSEVGAGIDTSRLTKALVTELKRYEPPGNVESVYIGGGTPTFMPEQDLMGLIDAVNLNSWNLKEFTVEANPGSAGLSLLRLLRQAGVNRLSIGGQSFNQAELDMLGRRHTPEDIVSTVNNARSAGFENISLDLIFAIPGSTLESFTASLQSATELDIEHISAYALTIEKDTPLKEDIDTGRVACVDEETDRAMYYTAIERLNQAGYGQYEISNFAKAGFQCKHNLTYWANLPWIGIGPSAASWYEGKRFANIADIDKYTDTIEQSKSPAIDIQIPDAIETACQTAVLNLRRTKGIDIADFQRRTGFDPMELFTESIKQNVRSGMLKITGDRIALTYEALPIADSVLCDFASV